MKKKFLAVLILICYFSTMIFAAGTTSSSNTTPESYTDDEFPDWAKYIRRFEIVTLGSLPFTTMTATTIYTSIRYAQNGFDSNYIPNPFAFTSSEANIDQDEQKIVLYTALATSLVLGIVDISIYVAKIEKAKKANKKVLPDFVQVQHLDDEGNLVTDSENQKEAVNGKKDKKNKPKQKKSNDNKSGKKTENTHSEQDNQTLNDASAPDEKKTDSSVEDESEVIIIME